MVVSRSGMMTSRESEAMIVSGEFCSQAPCEHTGIKSGSLETDVIQKFLSICLKQFFSSSQDDQGDTKEKSFSNSPEILKVCQN